ETPDMPVVEADAGKTTRRVRQRGDAFALAGIAEVAFRDPVVGGAFDGVERDGGEGGEFEEEGGDPHGAAEGVARLQEREGGAQGGGSEPDSAFFVRFAQAGGEQVVVAGFAAAARKREMSGPRVEGVE